MVCSKISRIAVRREEGDEWDKGERGEFPRRISLESNGYFGKAHPPPPPTRFNQGRGRKKLARNGGVDGE